MSNLTTVIIGGGTGGLVAANELRQKLPFNHKIVLIEKNSVHAFAPSFLWLMVGKRKAEEITKPVHLLVHPGIELVVASVTGVDVSRKKVTTTNGVFTFDFLIVALGAEYASETIPGLIEASHTFYSLDGAQKLQLALGKFTGGNISLVVSSMPYKCPGAPHEAVMLIADYYRKRGLQNSVNIHLYTPEPQPMPVAGQQLGEAVKQMLTERNISFHSGCKLNEINNQAHEIVFEKKDPVHYDLLIAVPPHRGSPISHEAGLSNESGWIPVDRSTLKTKYENIYAIGDATTVGIPGRWKPDVPMMLPKAGVFAHFQAEVVARRIADEIKSKTTEAKFYGLGYCALEAGHGLAGFAFGNFYAEPAPQLELRNVGRTWHAGKVLFEKWWLSPFGLKRSLLRMLINAGNKLMRIPVKM